MSHFISLVACCVLLEAPPHPEGRSNTAELKSKSAEIILDDKAPFVVPRGVDAIQYFEIANRTSESIELWNTFGCPSVRWRRWNESVGAGNTAEYEVFVDTRRHLGDLERRVSLQIAGTNERLNWRPRFYVRRDVVCHPSRFTFGPLEQGNTSPQVCTISCLAGAGWKVTRAESKHARVNVSAKETHREPGAMGLTRIDFEISAEVKKDVPPGELDDVVVLHTTDKRMPEIWILCEGTVTKPRKGQSD